MGDKEKAVDFPHFDPKLKKLPFPPTQDDYATAKKNSEQPPKETPTKKKDIVDVAKELTALDEASAWAAHTEGELPGYTDLTERFEVPDGRDEPEGI